MNILAAVFAVALVAGACTDDAGDSDDGVSTITFANWAAAEEATRPGMLDLIGRFEASHPDIKIESEPISFTEIAQNLILRAKAGNPPDVAQISGNDLHAVAATGALQPLEPLAKDLLTEIIPADLRAGTVNGDLLAIPWKDSPQGFWFNRTLMEKAGLDPESPPTTLDELADAMAAIKDKLPGVIPLGIDTTNRPFGLASQWPWMLTFGAQPFKGSVPTADTPEMEAYLTWIRDIARNDYTLPNKKIGDFRPLAAQNEVAFVFDQPVIQGVIQGVAEIEEEEFYETWGVTTQPVGPANQAVAIGLGHQLMMFETTEEDGKSEAAWEFMQFLATDPQAIEDYTVGVEGSLPPLANPSDEIQAVLDTPVLGAYREMIQPTVISPEYGTRFGQAATPVMAGVQEAITSKESVQSIAATMQSRLEDAFQ